MSLTKTTFSMISGAAVNVLDYGADALGVLDSRAAFVLAIATGKSVYVPDGTFLIDVTTAGAIILQTGQTLFGNGVASKVNIKNTSFVLTSAFQLNSNSSVISLNLDVANTTTAFVDNTENTDVLKNFNFNNYIIGLQGLTGSLNLRIENCTISHTWRAISCDDCVNLQIIDNTIYQTGVWFTQFYNCENVVFTNNICKYGGSGGGVSASSCKKSVFANNVVVSSGTGINFGGSSAVGYNVEEISITGNHVMSRDCILCENGTVGVSITGNYCTVLYDTSLGFSNGTGIACTSDSGGVVGGILGDINITGNTMINYNTPIGVGILIGSTAIPSFNMFGVVVANNVVNTNGNSGIELRMTSTLTAINDVSVTGNVVTANRGITLNNVTKAVVSGNVCKTSAAIIISNYYGIWSYIAAYTTISNNNLIGFGVSNKLETVTAVILDSNRTLPIPAGSGSDIESNVGSPSWFARNNGVVLQTSTATTLLINADSQVYTPATPVLIPALINGYVPSGSTVIIYFANGNTTIQSGGVGGIVLKGNATVNPADGNIITFVQLGSTLYETTRNF